MTTIQKIDARQHFFDRIEEVAEQFDGWQKSRLLAVFRASITLRGNPKPFWSALEYQLNAWQRVQGSRRDHEAKARFADIAQAVGSDVRWGSDEPSCGRCSDTEA